MRAAFIVLAWMLLSSPAWPGEFSVEIRAERSFGFFVGDLVRAIVEIRGPASAVLMPASLPHPMSPRISLNLRDVLVEGRADGSARIWRLKLTYQNFYAALDVRNIEIPGFQLAFYEAGAQRAVDVPAWRFGVAPLREITPEVKETGADYLRPEPRADFSDDDSPLRTAFLFAALGVILLVAVVWDRGWPPFHRRPARIFSTLARKLTATARQKDGSEILYPAMRDLHRAFDAAGGGSLLRADLAEFFLRYPEFASLRQATERFFDASEQMFFGVDGGAGSVNLTMEELVGFAKALAERERAR